MYCLDAFSGRYLLSSALKLITEGHIDLIESALQLKDKNELQEKIDLLQPKEDEALATGAKNIVGGINELNEQVNINEEAIQNIVNNYVTKDLLQFEIEQHLHSIISQENADTMISELLDILETN